MIQSMTAFARGDSANDKGALSWEIRTVNHRYLDTALRLPEGFRSQENDLKELVRQYLSRGKVDATLRFDPEGAETVAAINLDQELLDETLKDLVKARCREGERLVGFIEQRCDQIEKIIVAVTARREIVVDGARERLMQRIEGLDLEFDPARLEQELAIQAQRLDVSEELDRLVVHVQELRQILASGKAVGRRLDFLMQELNREANTLGSKSNDAETTRYSMDLKVLIEQMREQIQNIE